MIHKLGITIGEEEHVLTHEHLLNMMGEAYEWMVANINTYGEWTMYFGWNPVKSEFTVYSALPKGSSIESLVAITTDLKAPIRWAGTIFNELWDREFPLHVKMKSLQAQSQTCGELLEWLHDTKGILFAKYHEHTDDCYDEEICPPLFKDSRPPYCGMSDQMVYPINTQVTDLLHEFFGIDRKAFDREKQRMLDTL